MTPPTLGVMVTNYDSRDLTARCLEGVLSHREGVDRILVVDDASPEGPPAPPDPSVEVRVNPENLGLVRSLNLGIRTLGTDLVVLFDCDARPLVPFASQIRERFAADPRLAILGFATVDESGRPAGSHEEEPEVWSLLLGQRLHARYQRFQHRRRSRGNLCVYTCAMALRRAAFDELGGFDEAFDWLDLDNDLCMAARRAGWGVAHESQLVAFHQGAGSPQKVSHRVLRFYRNRWRLLRKFDKVRYPGLVRALILGRLGVELLALRLAGPLLVRDPEALRDKLAGRREVLEHVRREFR
jgi:GT2 family glycosyltransferase